MKKRIKTILQYLLAIISCLTIIVLLRIFVIDFYSISSSSMEPTLQSGDYILVNKLCHGARIYKNLHFLKNNTEPETYRIKGFSSIHHNDVVVFNFPYIKKKDTIHMNPTVFYVKRCIALPGDTLKIVNGYYEINKQKGFGNMDSQHYLSTFNELPRSIRYTIPYNKAFPWDIKNFGPLFIPAKGDSIEINIRNLCLYKKQIIYETHGHLEIRQNKVFLNNEELTCYTFTHNWYFMGGDNICNSQDCRYLGPIPEEYIIGKASIILSAKDKESGAYLWKRFFTFIQ